MLLEGLVLTRLYYNRGAWEQLPNHVTGDTQTNSTFRDATRLAANRMTSAYAIVRTSEAANRVLHEVQGSWINLTRRTTDWLHRLDPALLAEQRAVWSPEELTQWLKDTMTKGPKRIKRAMKRHTQQEAIMQEAVEAHHYIHKTRASNVEEHEKSSYHTCPQRGDAFKTLQAMTIHKWKKHGEISIERQLQRAQVVVNATGPHRGCNSISSTSGRSRTAASRRHSTQNCSM